VKRTRLKAVSDKRKTQQRQYWSLRKEFLKEHPVCEDCRKKRSGEVHHTRGRWGKLLVDTQYWMAVCWDCHAKIHENPRLAREKGYLYR
jgi:hypothetical protein